MSTPYHWGPCTPKYAWGWWRWFAYFAAVGNIPFQHPTYWALRQNVQARNDWWYPAEFARIWINSYSGYSIYPMSRALPVPQSGHTDLAYFELLAHNDWLANGSGNTHATWVWLVPAGDIAPTHHVWTCYYPQNAILNCSTGATYTRATAPLAGKTVLDAGWTWSNGMAMYIYNSGIWTGLSAVSLGGPCPDPLRYHHWTG
jgi:hypothetical protein